MTADIPNKAVSAGRIGVLATVLAGMLTFAGTADAVTVSAERIEAAVTAYVTEVAAMPDEEIEVTVSRAADVEVPEADDVAIAVSHRGDVPAGRNLAVTVRLTSGGDDLRRFSLTARITRYAVAAVAAVDLKSGDPLDAGNVVFRRADVTAFPDYLPMGDGIIGMSADRRITAGTILTEHHVRIPYDVQRGDKVMIEVRTGSCMLKAAGIARENGRVGDEIRVHIDETNATVTCRVVDSRTVVIGDEG